MPYKYSGVEVIDGVAEEVSFDPKWTKERIAKALTAGFTHEQTRAMLAALFDSRDLPPDYGDAKYDAVAAAIAYGDDDDAEISAKYDAVAAAIAVLEALDEV